MLTNSKIIRLISAIFLYLIKLSMSIHHNVTSALVWNVTIDEVAGKANYIVLS